MSPIHDTHMSQYIPPTLFHCVTGTWVYDAGNVAGTIVTQKAAAAETTVVSIPITLPSNSVALKGSLLKSIEVDYEILTAAATSITAVLHKITRGADTAVAVVTTQASTQDLTAATAAATVDQHKLTVTVTVPPWIDNDEEFILELTCVCALTTVLEFLGAVVNYTARF